MAASSEIRFKIGGDTSSLSRAFVAAQSLAAAAGKQIHKKLGLQDALKQTVLSLGVSIENISKSIAELFSGGAQESWKSGLDAAEEAARIIEESTQKRMSTLRQIADLEKNIQRNAANESSAPKVQDTLMSKILSTVGAGLGGINMPAAAYLTAKGAGMAKETEAEATARALQATAKRLADEAKIDDLKEKQTRNEERIATARRALDAVGMTDEQKLDAMVEEQMATWAKLDEAKRKGADSTDLEVSVLNQGRAIREQILKIEQDTTNETEKRTKKVEDLLKNYDDARQASVDASQREADAHHDAVAFGLDEAASGKRGTSRDRSLARQIQRDEAMAKRLFDSGNTVSQFEGGRNVNRDFSFFQDRAGLLRKDFDRLTTSDQNPFKGVEDQLKTANEHLASLDSQLQSEDIE